MKQSVVLSVRGRQSYPGQEPELLELVTEGTVEKTDTGWILEYQESDLTGMEGVTTVFEIEGKKITLSRTGKLNSQMVFQEGQFHDSLYQVEFGTLMITVCASKVDCQLTEAGGTIDLVYTIEVEQSAAGTIDYHLEVTPQK